jgi:PKHD-type hydroxylase
MINIKLLTEEPFVSGSMAWSFYKDNIELQANANQLFTKAQCESIIKLGIKGLNYAEIGKGIVDKTTRNSRTAWISPANGNEWIFQRLTDAVLAINEHYFKFDLWGMAEGLQFTEYKEPSGMYNPHVDCMYKGPVRKLSLSVQLSDSNDYEGGEFVINNGTETISSKEQGTLIAFPSYALHGVKPVTKGTRYSLVAWMTGPQFK